MRAEEVRHGLIDTEWRWRSRVLIARRTPGVVGVEVLPGRKSSAASNRFGEEGWRESQ